MHEDALSKSSPIQVHKPMDSMRMMIFWNTMKAPATPEIRFLSKLPGVCEGGSHQETMLSVCVLLAALSCFGLYASQVPIVDEDILEAYFRTNVPSLHKEGRHGDFVTLEEHDMSNYWGFFKLPAEDDLIVGPESVVCHYFNGLGVYSLSLLLEYTLSKVREDWKASCSEEPYRLGFFKLFPNRHAHRTLDAYLHHLNGGGRLFLTVPDAEKMMGSGEKADALFQELCYFLSNEFDWQKELVGVTILYSASNELKLELWTGPECTVSTLRLMKSDFESRTFLAGNGDGIKLQVEEPEIMIPDEDKAAEIQALFTKIPETISDEAEAPKKPLTNPWIVLAASSTRAPRGSYELAHAVQRHSSLVTDIPAFDKLCNESLFQFPGVLSKNSTIVFLKKGYLNAAEEQLALSGKLFTINFRPAVHQSHITAIHGLPSYSLYTTAFYWAAKHLLKTNNILLDAVFFHFEVLTTNTSPKQARLTIEFWVKKNIKNNQINNIKSGISDYLSRKLVEEF